MFKRPLTARAAYPPQQEEAEAEQVCVYVCLCAMCSCGGAAGGVRRSLLFRWVRVRANQRCVDSSSFKAVGWCSMSGLQGIDPLGYQLLLSMAQRHIAAGNQQFQQPATLNPPVASVLAGNKRQRDSQSSEEEVSRSRAVDEGAQRRGGKTSSHQLLSALSARD